MTNADIMCSCCVSLVCPVIRGADITAQTRIDITSDQPLDYHWVGHGFKVHIPAGVIREERGPVTLCIQASLSGDYQLPDDGVLASGVYWLSLHPHVKSFSKKATVTIQHCASDNDSALSFLTAKCTQKSLPYTFKSLEGGSFLVSGCGTILCDRFSALAVSASSISEYAFCSYCMAKQLNVYDVHIAVIPNLHLYLKVIVLYNVGSFVYIVLCN